MPGAIRCRSCADTFPTRDGLALATTGFHVSYFGWFYGIITPREVELARKQRRKPRKFKLVEPIEFLQELAAWLALGVVENLAYDIIKAGARNLYERYKRKKVPRSELQSQVVTPSEVMRNLPRFFGITKTYLESEHYEDPAIRTRPRKIKRRVLMKIEQTYDIVQRVTRRTRAARVIRDKRRTPGAPAGR